MGQEWVGHPEVGQGVPLSHYQHLIQHLIHCSSWEQIVRSSSVILQRGSWAGLEVVSQGVGQGEPDQGVGRDQ